MRERRTEIFWTSYRQEILSRIAQTIAALTRLKPVWNDRSISLSSKIQRMRSLVTSILLYACESWTLTAELQRRIQAMEMRCYRKILCISYNDHVTNEEVHAKIQQAIGPHEDLLTIVKRHKRSGLVMSPVHQVWPKPSCKAQWKGRRRQGRQRKVGRQHQGMDRPGVRQVPGWIFQTVLRLVVQNTAISWIIRSSFQF